MASTRLPRFKRSSQIPRFRLTDRDREILQHVHRHRFLRSSQLTSLLTGSRQQTLRRLQRLYHHGFLERPRCQLDYYHSGSRAMVYGLATKGAGLLHRKLALPYPDLDWSGKNKVTRLFLEHALLISEVMVAVERAVRDRPDVRLLRVDDLAEPPTRTPFQWKVEIDRNRLLGVIPDQVFGLEFAKLPAGRNRVWFCLEADRGTMPIVRSNPNLSSYRRKLVAYAATWSQHIHERLGMTRFRVLTVTTHSDRLAPMKQICRSLPRGQGLFLFTTADALRNEPDFLTHSWQLCWDGETATVWP